MKAIVNCLAFFRCWSLVVWIQSHQQDQEWFGKFWEYRGYRRAIGGYWGRWEVVMGGVMGTFKVWWPSQCEHYPPPILVNSTEPLETEEYL